MFKRIIFLFMCMLSLSCTQSRKLAGVSNGKNAATRVIAHRGAWKNTGLPQNSVAGFKAAIAQQCYGSEMDVHMTADGHIIVNHDPTYHGLRVQQATLAELRAFRLSNGEELPLLSDFLKVLVGQRHTKLIVEIKPSQRGKEWALKTADAVTREIAQYEASGLVEYISFDYEICKQVKRNVPDAVVQYLNGDKAPAQILADGLSGIDYHFSVFQKHPEYLKECKELGLITNAWTVNEPALMVWLIEQGIDFITTDQPELLAARLEELSAASPHP